MRNSIFITDNHLVYNQGNARQVRKNLALQEAARKQRIIEELKAVGVKKSGLLSSESRSLPSVLHEGEHIQGVVYGLNNGGFAMLVATNLRALFLDKKPLMLQEDEVTYDLVGGVTYGAVGLFATVVLHTRVGDFKLRTMNITSAKIFVNYIEQRCLEHLQGNGRMRR